MRATKSNANKYSKNAKLNAVLMEIEEDLLMMCESEEESRKEIKRYMREFYFESDFNLCSYGNVLIYYYDIRAMYERAGYKSVKRWNNEQLVSIYKRQVGYIARQLVK